MAQPFPVLSVQSRSPYQPARSRTALAAAQPYRTGLIRLRRRSLWLQTGIVDLPPLEIRVIFPIFVAWILVLG